MSVVNLADLCPLPTVLLKIIALYCGHIFRRTNHARLSKVYEDSKLATLDPSGENLIISYSGSSRLVKIPWPFQRECEYTPFIDPVTPHRYLCVSPDSILSFKDNIQVYRYEIHDHILRNQNLY